MKGQVICLDHIAGREAAARVIDGRLDDLLIDGKGRPRPGSVHIGKLDRPLKGQGGGIVQAGGRFFLRQTKGVRPSDRLALQVTGYAEPGKAPPATTKLVFKGRFAIATPDAPGLNISRSIRDDDLRDSLRMIAHPLLEGRSEGLILRSAAAEADPDELIDDIQSVLADADAVAKARAAGTELGAVLDGDGPHLLAWREWTGAATVHQNDGSFADAGILDQLAEALSPTVALGAFRMTVEPTRALVAVDVDTGADTSPAAALKANIAAVQALPRALRLRGLGGQIVVDAAPMPKGQRRQVEEALRRALKADPVETAFVGWTALGHLELQRKRERLPLTEALPRDVLEELI